MSGLTVTRLLDEIKQPLEVIPLNSLQQLSALVDSFWPEIADAASLIERSVNENIQKNSPQCRILHGVLSKLFYHLGDMEKSFYHFIAGDGVLNIDDPSPYTDALSNFAIEEYLSRKGKNDDDDTNSEIYKSIVSLFDKVVQKSMETRNYRNAIALAIDSSSMELFRSIFKKIFAENIQDDREELFKFIIKAVKKTKSFPGQQNYFGFLYVASIKYNLLGIFERFDLLYQSRNLEHMRNFFTALIIGVNPFVHLLSISKEDFSDDILNLNNNHLEEYSSKEYETIAYQLAFDLIEATDQYSIHHLLSTLCVPFYFQGEFITLKESSISVLDCMSSDNSSSPTFHLQKLMNAMKEMQKLTLKDNILNLTREQMKEYASLFPQENILCSTIIRRILKGEYSCHLNLQYLYTHSQINPSITNEILARITSRNSISSTALVISNAYATCGTAQDAFVRKNRTWFATGSNWTKFIAVSSLGVIHKGNINDSQKLLSAFLPKNSESVSPYQEGGALLAMGLIHSANGSKQLPYLIEKLRSSSGNEIVQHGACLSVGICSLGTNNDEAHSILKEVLYNDNPIAGQAAGIAIGMNKMGGETAGQDSNSITNFSRELLDYVRETKHNKIVRGVCIGIALMHFRRDEAADSIIDLMCSDENPIVRYASCFVIAMAYVGTESTKATSKLLEMAVSDISDQVRRSAVMSLAFLFYSSPSKLATIVKPFIQSFNSHSRYGALMALAIGCSSTGDEKVLSLIDPLIKDKIPFISNAANMAKAMVLIQPIENQRSIVNSFAQDLYKTIKSAGSNDFSSYIKSSAIISIGILSLGGRNCHLALSTFNGRARPTAIAGALLFLQHWYWFPFYHFLSLAVTPSTIIPVTDEFKIPCNLYIHCKDSEKFDSGDIEIKAKESFKRQSSRPSRISLSNTLTKKIHRSLIKTSLTSSPKILAMTPHILGLKKGDGQKNGEGVVAMEDDQMCRDSKIKESDFQSREEYLLLLKTIGDEESAFRLPHKITRRQRTFVKYIKGQRYTQWEAKLEGVSIVKNSLPDEREDAMGNKYIEESV